MREDLSVRLHVGLVHNGHLWIDYQHDREGIWKGYVPRKAHMTTPRVKSCKFKVNQRTTLDTSLEIKIRLKLGAKEEICLTSPNRMSQSSASNRILATRRAKNLKTTAMQAIVKQIAFATMMSVVILSEMCISCSIISAGVGRVAMLSESWWVSFPYVEGNVFRKEI